MNAAPNVDLRGVFTSHEDLADPAAVGRLAETAHARVAARAGSRQRVTRPTALVAALVVGVAVMGTVAGTAALLGRPDRAAVLPADPPLTTGPFAGPATELLKRYSDLTAAAEQPALPVVGELEQYEGILEHAAGADYKSAIISGHLVASGPLPTGSAQGWITMMATSARVVTPLMTADETLAALRSPPRDCQGCTDVMVTAASPTTMTITVLGGQAEVPAWKFRLEGTSFQIVRAAIPARSLVSLKSGTTRLTGTVDMDSYVVAPDGRSLDVRFGGSPATGVCGRRYAAHAYESSDAVVVAITDVGPVDPTAPEDQFCTALGHGRQVTVSLGKPLDGRAVIDLAWGRLVPVGAPTR